VLPKSVLLLSLTSLYVKITQGTSICAHFNAPGLYRTLSAISAPRFRIAAAFLAVCNARTLLFLTHTRPSLSLDRRRYLRHLVHPGLTRPPRVPRGQLQVNPTPKMSSSSWRVRGRLVSLAVQTRRERYCFRVGLHDHVWLQLGGGDLYQRWGTGVRLHLKYYGLRL